MNIDYLSNHNIMTLVAFLTTDPMYPISCPQWLKTGFGAAIAIGGVTGFDTWVGSLQSTPVLMMIPVAIAFLYGITSYPIRTSVFGSMSAT